MVTKPASEPTSLVVGIATFCVLTVATGWLVLRGGSLEAAIPAMGVSTFAFVELLVRSPRSKR